MRITAALLALLLPLSALAQPTCPAAIPDPVPRDAVRLSWTAPTQNTDGTAVKTPIDFTIYEGTVAKCIIRTTTAASLTGLSVGAHSWAVTAKTTDGESAKSNVASKTIAPAPPNPPSNLLVDPASLTAWVLAPTTNKVALLAVGTLTPGTQCDPTQPVLDKFVVLVDAAHPVIKPPTSTNKSVVYLGTCG